MRRSGLVGLITLVAIILISVIVLGICTCKVPAGYVAVQYNMRGGVQDEVLTQGWHLVSPTVHTTNYTIGIEQSYLTADDKGDSPMDESFSASSSEGKDIRVDLTFTYQYDMKSVTDVFNRFKGQSGKDVRDSFIKPNIVSWSKEIIARYKVADILGAERANINVALTDYLAQKFEPYGILISNVSLINLEVDNETSEAINKKIKAQQEAETQAINNQIAVDKAEADALVLKTQTQADADAKLIKAEADAEAKVIKAEAEAEANRKVNESLTDKILKKNYYDKWDGSLPNVILGEEPSIMMNLDQQ